MEIRLYRVDPAYCTLLKEVRTNDDGRVDPSLLASGELMIGTYELRFQVAAYFRSVGVRIAEPAFLDEVPIRFGVADADVHYHVPLLVSPWAYSTYRGS
jgi:5-hydroxyisourate hydrolase